MLRSDHRGLRNRDLKLMWVVVGVEGENRDSLALVNSLNIIHKINWGGAPNVRWKKIMSLSHVP